MSSIQTSLLVKFIMVGLLVGELNAGLVPVESTEKETLKNDELAEQNHNDKLSKLIDFFNMYDSMLTSEERGEHDENLSEQEIDDREIELLMLTLPRMGRELKEETDEPKEFTSDELAAISNHPIKLIRRAIPRFGKRALPRFGKRAIPRLG